jgi:N,N'-diacetylchitobiose transport system permease protein
MDRRSFYAFASPSLVLMISLMVIPLAMAIYMGTFSVTYFNLDEPKFVGLDNYRAILTDPRFWQSLQFTLLIILIVTPTEMVLGFIIALLLDQVPRRPRGAYIALLLTTYVTVPVVSALIFRQLFQPTGLVYWFMQDVLGQRMLLNEATVKTQIMIYGVWRDTPFCIVVLFAGLQSLSTDLLEAAAIDGASRWQQIRYITIPHLMPLFILIAMIVIMDKYRIFDAIFVLTQMNPVYKADTIMTYNWRTAMELHQLGKANAMAVLTVIGIMVVLIPFLYRTYRHQIEER